MRKFQNRLMDIADAARLIGEYVQGMTKEAFLADTRTQSAVIFRLALIGEAVKALPEEWKVQHNTIPWSQIARMRDFLIHAYFATDLNII